VTTTVEDLDFGRRAAILVGNEHEGLSRSAIEDADQRFAIPMPGMTRSLNLSVAAALITERATVLRRAALGAAGDLDEAAQLRLRARFYAASVRGAEAVLARAAR
jgi:tRNA (guanosine-2'-O-)-methyltransferase